MQEGQPKLPFFLTINYPLPPPYIRPLSGRVRTAIPKIKQPRPGIVGVAVPMPGRGRPRAPPTCSYLADILVGGEHPLQGDKHLADGHGSRTWTKIRASWDRAHSRRAATRSRRVQRRKGPSRPPSRESVLLAASSKRLRLGEADCCCEPERAGSPFPLTGCFAAVRPWTEVFLAVRATRKAALREELTPVRAYTPQFCFQPKRKRSQSSRPGKFLWLEKVLVELRGVISCARSRTSGFTRPAVPRERGPFSVSARFALLSWGGGGTRSWMA